MSAEVLCSYPIDKGSTIRIEKDVDQDGVITRVVISRHGGENKVVYLNELKVRDGVFNRHAVIPVKICSSFQDENGTSVLIRGSVHSGWIVFIDPVGDSIINHISLRWSGVDSPDLFKLISHRTIILDTPNRKPTDVIEFSNKTGLPLKDYRLEYADLVKQGQLIEQRSAAEFKAMEVQAKEIERRRSLGLPLDGSPPSSTTEVKSPEASPSMKQPLTTTEPIRTWLLACLGLGLFGGLAWLLTRRRPPGP